MTRNPIAATFTFAAALLVAGTAAAAAPANAEYYPFTDAASIVKTTDKASAPAAVVKKNTEASTRKMGAQPDKPIPDQSREIEMYLKAGR